MQLPRPIVEAGEAPDNVAQMAAEAGRGYELLTDDIKEVRESSDEKARWLLAHMLEYFRREEKCMWWDYFTLQAMEYDELLRENRALAGLNFIEEREPDKGKLPIHVYEFPIQDTILTERARFETPKATALVQSTLLISSKTLWGLRRRGPQSTSTQPAFSNLI